jgi:hypothetical protein
MSLTVRLERPGEPEELFSGNITHNLGSMAQEAGIHLHLWCPEDLNIAHAHGLIARLKAGLKLLQSDPQRFKAFSPKNGWGTYECLVTFVQKYLEACEAYPDAKICVSK